MTATQTLVNNILATGPDDIPPDVRHEARRAILNITGCALGGAFHPAMAITIQALGPYSGPPTAPVLGRTERFDPFLAALLNGISTHIHDYDDTVPKNFIHASTAVAAALFAHAGGNRLSGRDFLHAFILGFEVTSRIGNATYPAYYQAGWHSTGSLGVFGATAAIGTVLGLDARQMTNALGMAATQSSGIREMFGSMAKALHPGHAAQNGIRAALLAQQGMTAGHFPLEGPRGIVAVTIDEYDLDRISEDWGTRFELRDNTYKPFPSGIVIHPTIDACIQLREEHGLAADQIAGVALRVAPIVKDLCNKQEIGSGLEAKFSIYHAAAIGLARGKGGLAEFTDAAASDPLLERLRRSTTATADPTVSEDAVVVEIRLHDGRTVGKTLQGSRGNLARPLNDAQLEAKFREQAGALAPAQTDAAIAACWALDTIADMTSLIALITPEKTTPQPQQFPESSTPHPATQPPATSAFIRVHLRLRIPASPPCLLNREPTV